MKPESKMIEWEKTVQPTWVRIKTWDQMASEGEIDNDGDILLPSETYFTTLMEEHMPIDRIVNLVDMRWQDPESNAWVISDDMIEKILKEDVIYKTRIRPWKIFYIPRTRKLMIECEKHPLNTWKKWTPEDVKHMGPRAESWWRKHKEDLLNSIEQLELED